jgi:hypothetical protein
MSENTETVPRGEAEQAVEDIVRRLALLHQSYARVLVEALGEEQGTALVREAIRLYGTRVGERTRARVIARGIEPTIANMRQGSDLSPLGFVSEEVVVEGERRTRNRRCVLAETWHEYGEDALGSLYCLVDPAKAQAYDPAWTMVHTLKIPDGAPYCEMALRRRNREEKR